MASKKEKDDITTFEVAKERLARAVEKKKKESSVLPLLEKLFYFQWDNSILPLMIDLLIHESKKVNRYAYYFIANADPSAIGAEVMQKIQSVIRKDLYSDSPLRVVYILRVLANLAKLPSMEGSVVEYLTDVIERAEKDEKAKGGISTAKKKATVGKNLLEEHAAGIAQSEAFLVFRSRPSLDSSLWPQIARGAQHYDPIAARHALGLGYRLAVQNPNAAASMFSQFLASEKKGRLEFNREDTTARIYYIRICTTVSVAPGIPNADAFWQEIKLFVLDPEDSVAFEAIAGLVKSSWGKLASAPMAVSSPTGPITLLSTIINKLTAVMAGQHTPAVHAACRLTKLMAENYITHFEKTEAGSDFMRRPSTADLDISESSMIDASLDLSNDSESSAASTPRSHAGDFRPRQSIDEGGMELYAALEAARAAETPTRSRSRSDASAKAKSTVKAPPVPAISLPSAQQLATQPARKGQAKKPSADDVIRKTRQEDTEKNHPLNELRAGILVLFKSKGSVYVRLKSLTALIWLTYGWNVKKLEELIIAECQSLPAHLLDEIFEELHRRLRATPDLAETILAMFYHVFCNAPAKVSPAILMAVWKTVMGMKNGRHYVLHNIFRFLDQLHNRDTRLLTFNMHRAVYWFLGEQANTLVGETVASSRGFVSEGVTDADEDVVENDNVCNIHNLSMKSVVLRLEQGMAFGVWEIRVTCAEAIGKISLQSSWPLRLHALELLQQASRETGSCISHVAHPYVRLLGKLFELRKRFVLDLKKGAKASADDKKLLRRDIDALSAEIDLLADLRGANPVGLDVAEFLARK